MCIFVVFLSYWRFMNVYILLNGCFGEFGLYVLPGKDRLRKTGLYTYFYILTELLSVLNRNVTHPVFAISLVGFPEYEFWNCLKM